MDWIPVRIYGTKTYLITYSLSNCQHEKYPRHMKEVGSPSLPDTLVRIAHRDLCSCRFLDYYDEMQVIRKWSF